MTKHNCKRVKSKISKVPKAIARFGLKFYKLTFLWVNHKIFLNTSKTKEKKLEKQKRNKK